MTGFARMGGNIALNNNQNPNWVWEIKSVNGKGLDIKHRIPQGFEDVLAPCKEALSANFSRGSFFISLELSNDGGESKYKINQDLLKQLSDIAVSWHKNYPEDFTAPSISELLSVNGVIEKNEANFSEDDAEKLNTAIISSFNDAISEMKKSRLAEGDKMKQVLLGLIDKMADLRERAEKCSALMPQKIKERVSEAVSKLLDDNNLPEERIAQEVVLYSVRFDVREELDRLKAHVESAREMLKKGGSIGRKLDFLCQEFNREANTTCSKSNDIELTQIALELKSTIDQFREQTQNIE